MEVQTNRNFSANWVTITRYWSKLVDRIGWRCDARYQPGQTCGREEDPCTDVGENAWHNQGERDMTDKKMTDFTAIDRRGFLRRGTAFAGAAGLEALPEFPRPSLRTFPDRNLDIIIPTGEGGGADRDSRVFTKIWAKSHRYQFRVRVLSRRRRPGRLRVLHEQGTEPTT